MSVITTADEHLDKARDKVKSAILDLNEILIKECWGHDEFSEEFTQKLELAFTKLRNVDKMLHNK